MMYPKLYLIVTTLIVFVFSEAKSDCYFPYHSPDNYDFEYTSFLVKDTISIHDYFKNKKLSEYLCSKKDSIIEIMRLINVQNYVKPFFRVTIIKGDFFFNPDVLYLYLNQNHELHLVFWNDKFNRTIDTIIKTDKMDFKYLTNIKNYRSFSKGEKFELSYGKDYGLGPYKGTGIGISIWKNGESFNINSKDFWIYSHNGEHEFRTTYCRNVRITREVIKMLRYLSTIYEFKDKERDDTNNYMDAWLKYKKTRHLIIDKP